MKRENAGVGEADSTNTYGDRAPFGSVGGGGRTKSGSRRYTRAVFTQLRAARMRKTLLLLVCVYWILAQERWTLPD